MIGLNVLSRMIFLFLFFDFILKRFHNFVIFIEYHTSYVGVAYLRFKFLFVNILVRNEPKMNIVKPVLIDHPGDFWKVVS